MSTYFRNRLARQILELLRPTELQWSGITFILIAIQQLRPASRSSVVRVLTKLEQKGYISDNRIKGGQHAYRITAKGLRSLAEVGQLNLGI